MSRIDDDSTWEYLAIVWRCVTMAELLKVEGHSHGLVAVLVGLQFRVLRLEEEREYEHKRAQQLKDRARQLLGWKL